MRAQRGFVLFAVPAIAVAGLFLVTYHSKHRSEPRTAAACECEANMPDQENVKPNPSPPALGTEMLGASSHVHDPSIAKDGKNYYVFSTGPGISMRSSSDRVTWKEPVRVFDVVPAWTATTIPGSREFYWAPDISYFNHRWHLYYAVSTFGKNRSAIGLATNVTLDPTRKDYHWVDEGPAFQSYPTDNFNAIDPNIAFDSKGDPYMSFGSFWSGIRIVKLDPKTGKPASPETPSLSVASRPHTKEQPGAIEAPFIVRKGRFYYLFVSFDFCCRGVNSTYNIRVGRSKEITGPYVDREGAEMTAGGGTLVLAGGQRWKGPGGCSVLSQGRKHFLVYHTYDAKENGVPKLRIEPIEWDKEAWPHVPTGEDAK